MTAPSKIYTSILDAACAPEKPVDTVLITALRDNDVHHFEWIGKNYTPAVDHDHDGVNSKLLPASIMGNLFAYRNFI